MRSQGATRHVRLLRLLLVLPKTWVQQWEMKARALDRYAGTAGKTVQSMVRRCSSYKLLGRRTFSITVATERAGRREC